MDVLRVENEPLQTSCHTEVKTDYSIHQEQNVIIHDTTDQDFPTLEYLTQHLNEGIIISSETLEEGSNYDVSEDDGGWLLMWGCGEFGQHGHGHQNDVNIAAGTTNPLIIGQDGLVALADCGSSHTVVVTDDNKIFSWGNCNSGQLGIGDTKTILQPHLVQLGVKPGTRIRGVKCGTRHTFIWTEAGDCFSFGNNFSAQLGYDFRKPDFKENQLRPVYLETLFNQKIQQVACGSRHSVFLFTSGNVASVGSNDRGQLGHSGKIDSVCIQKVVDVQNVSVIGCGNCHSLAADRDGNVYAWGYGKACGSKEDIVSPIIVSCLADDDTSVKGVIGGDSHSLLLLDNGKLMSWGNNFEGQLGQGNSVKFQSKPSEIKGELLEEKVINISAGESISAAVTESGRLFMWGKNLSQVILEEEGSRYCQFEPHPIPLGKWKATKVACGAWHVACVVSQNTRPNTWDWTPPLVDIPALPEHQFNAEQFTENILYDTSDSQSGEKNSKVEDVVEDNKYTEKASNIINNNLELTAQTKSDNGIEDHVDNHLEKGTFLSENDGPTEKPCNSVDTYTELTIQHENGIGIKDVNCIKKETAFSDHNGQKENHCHINNCNTELPDKSFNDVEIKGNVGSVKKETPLSVDSDKRGTQFSNQREPLPETIMLAGNSKKKKSKLPQTDSKSKHKIDKTHPEERNYLGRTSSEDSVNCNITSQTKPISKSLCSIEVEQSRNGRELSPERRGSTGTIRSTSRIHSGSALNRNTGNQSANTSVHVDAEQNIVSQIKPRALTVEARDYTLPDAQLKVSTGVSGQLNREKRAPRHIRRVPSVPKMEYHLLNQTLQTSDVKEDVHQQKYVQKATINRTNSSPNITSNYPHSDIHAITLSMPSTPPSGIHIPHPPQADWLPPKHPRFRKQHSSHKIVFSSGSSWRKRNSKI